MSKDNIKFWNLLDSLTQTQLRERENEKSTNFSGEEQKTSKIDPEGTFGLRLAK